MVPRRTRRVSRRGRKNRIRNTKNLGDESIQISPTTVRVPIVRGHAEALTLETETPISPDRARKLLEQAPGIEVIDDFESGKYSSPIDAADKDPVYISRIRKDIGNPNGLQMWVVADNLRKGAALNAIQIAEGISSTLS